MSIATEEKIALNVDNVRIKLLVSEGLPSILTSLFVCLLLALSVLLETLSPTILSIWIASIVIVTVFRLFFIYTVKSRLSRSDKPLNREQVQKYEVIYSIGSFLNGLTIGLLSFTIDPSWPLGTQFIIPFVLIGLSAGAMSSSSSSLLSYYSFIVPTLIPLFFVLYGMDIKIASVFLMIHFIFIGLIAKRLNSSIVAGIRLGFQQEEYQKELEMMAHYDALTQLPNRALFADRFQQAVAHSHRTESILAIIFIDIDNFKPVNDKYGHEVGDKLLIEVANRIKGMIREEDTVSRQGGDEFALLLRDVDSFSQCEETIKRIRYSLAQPYFNDDIIHRVTISVGCTLYPLDDADLDTLLRHADQAMYQAKLSGKDQLRLFNSSFDQHTIDIQARLKEIKRALANKEFSLYYQPKVNMKTGKVFGVEALIRWIHPEKGIIPPLDFLPLIEGADIEVQLGGWVINEALQQLDIWQQQGLKLEVSINVSSHHLQSPIFFDQLNEALDEHPDVDSQDLQLEILESSVLGDIKTISGIITSCQNVLGVNVALDDFGTGYSSLTHMKSLSANVIKIDQTFVRDLLDDPHDYSIIDGIIGLTKAFSRDVIAEGIETDQHGMMLLIMGCEKAQGYGISRPIPADDIPSWLAEYSPNQLWLDYASQRLSLQQEKIMLLKMTTQNWLNNVKDQLRTNEETAFGKYFMKCHLNAWLARFEQEKIFQQGWLDKLKNAHDLMFSYAEMLVNQHLIGKLEIASNQLDELDDRYSLVCKVLEVDEAESSVSE